MKAIGSPSWHSHGRNLRRFAEPHRREAGQVNAMRADDPAAVEGRTRYRATVVWPGLAQRILKSGWNSKKIGARVTKGEWSGMPIYTLTLEERATCPRSCTHWLDCFGNKMHWAERLMHGPALERRLGAELKALQAQHPGGYVVRLHVLGDFYSVAYVRRWLSWLRRFPALRVFGYTAWRPSTPIGALVAAARDRMWDRVAIRTSDSGGDANTYSAYSAQAARHWTAGGRAIICPQQQNKTECCGTCSLCWATRRPIVFLAH
ncbi:GP88 family protein [Inquilinus sp. CA228]|uniref:GP88 family protein n=1 Tax=Inquilinus sp. CA228 TaxID=3455609 RepID=UPI003F8D5166